MVVATVRSNALAIKCQTRSLNFMDIYGDMNYYRNLLKVENLVFITITDVG